MTACQKNVFASNACWRYALVKQLIHRQSLYFQRYFHFFALREDGKTNPSVFFFRPLASYGPCAKRQMDSIMGRERRGKEPFGKNEGRKAKYTPQLANGSQMPLWQFQTSRLMTFNWKAKLPALINPKSHLNPTQFDKAIPLICLQSAYRAGCLHHYSLSGFCHRRKQSAILAHLFCMMTADIFHRNLLSDKISHGTCFREHKHFFLAKVPSQKRFPLCPETSHIIPLEMLAH